MLSVEEQVEIKVLARQGLSIREISRQLQVSRNTVRRYLREVNAAQRKPREARVHKLDPYKRYIEDRLRAAHPSCLPATVLCQEIKLLGYSGGLSRVCQFVRGLRVIRPEEPLVRFETPAGQQMQCDWVVFRRGRYPLSAFVATLGWSRASYVEFRYAIGLS
jgi:transposase